MAALIVAACTLAGMSARLLERIEWFVLSLFVLAAFVLMVLKFSEED
ncbi:MAG: hypothetical protein NZ805_08875 [Armatimonadetes bacterium]|nr:hypothetical protein [Armatimonadota bacterium]MDW8028219.1 hypothetical protein [Armatimonadota bacterium]